METQIKYFGAAYSHALKQLNAKHQAEIEAKKAKEILSPKEKSAEVSKIEEESNNEGTAYFKEDNCSTMQPKKLTEISISTAPATDSAASSGFKFDTNTFGSSEDHSSSENETKNVIKLPSVNRKLQPLTLAKFQN